MAVVVASQNCLLPSFLGDWDSLRGGQFTLALHRGTGLRFAIQTSPDLLVWSNFQVVTGANAPVLVGDTNAFISPRHFYRAMTY